MVAKVYKTEGHARRAFSFARDIRTDVRHVEQPVQQRIRNHVQITGEFGTRDENDRKLWEVISKIDRKEIIEFLFRIAEKREFLKIHRIK